MVHSRAPGFPVLLVAAAFLVGTCTPASFPLKITDLSASPDPVVGRIVNLEVETESSRDEADVTILIQLPEGVRLIDGELTWRGSLVAGEPYRHRASLCVLYEGDWRVDVTASSRLGPDDVEGDYKTIHLISTSEKGEAIPGQKYRIIQGSPAPFQTPSPVPTPATCS